MEPRAYLTTEGFRYRFPFPDANGQDWTNLNRRACDRRLAVGVPHDMAEIDHGTICHSANCTGGYNVNVILSCPAAKEFVVGLLDKSTRKQ